MLGDLKGGDTLVVWRLDRFGRSLKDLVSKMERLEEKRGHGRFDEEDVPQLQALLQNEDVSTREICERFGVSEATLYRYVGPEGKRQR